MDKVELRTHCLLKPCGFYKAFQETFKNLETHSFTLKDTEGKPVRFEGPQMAVEDLVPLIPPTAYRAVTVREKTYWTFTLVVRLPGLGKVRLVVSFKSAELTGTYVVLALQN